MDNLEIKGGKFLESKEEMSSNTNKKLIFEEIFLKKAFLLKSKSDIT